MKDTTRALFWAFGLVWLLTLATLTVGGRGLGILTDDAYYYFEISRNAAIGQGFTFDSQNPTNGFHPLWSWLLVPLFWLFPTSMDAPLRSAQLMCVVFNFATSLIVYRHFDRRGRSKAGCFAGVLYLINPFSLYMSLFGLESSLSTMLLAASYSQFARLREQEDHSWKAILSFGSTVGLCLLARTDNIFWLAVSTTWLTSDLLKKRRVRRVIASAAIFGVAVLFLLSPWLIWNLRQFGSVVQSSYLAKSKFKLYGSLSGNPFADVKSAARRVGDSVLREEWAPTGRAKMLVFVGVLAFGAGALAALRSPQHGKESTLTPLLAYSGIQLVWYFIISRSFYEWYVHPLAWVSVIALGEGISAHQQTARKWAAFASAILLSGAAAVSIFAGLRHFLAPPFPVDRWEQLVAAERVLPKGSRVGAWNAGAAGYLASFLAPNLTIINLDGVVNNPLAMTEGPDEYLSYLGNEVDYLIESPNYVEVGAGVSRAQDFVQNVESLGASGIYRMRK